MIYEHYDFLLILCKFLKIMPIYYFIIELFMYVLENHLTRGFRANLFLWHLQFCYIQQYLRFEPGEHIVLYVEIILIHSAIEHFNELWALIGLSTIFGKGQNQLWINYGIHVKGNISVSNQKVLLRILYMLPKI